MGERMEFEEVFADAGSAGLSASLVRLTEYAVDVLDADGGAIVLRGKDGDVVLVERGLPPEARGVPVPVMDTAPGRRSVSVCRRMSDDAILREHPWHVRAPNWEWLASARVPVIGLPWTLSLVVGGWRAPARGEVYDRLRPIAELVGDQIELLNRIVVERALRPTSFEGLEEESGLYAPLETDERAATVAAFLIDSLVAQSALRRRGDVRYHVLRRWRAPLREWQILALRRLKRDLPASFVDEVSAEIVRYAAQTFGSGAFDAVTAVPCGSSGPGCLSDRLGRRTAELLGIDYVEAFEPLEARGSSHPRRNVRRTSMKPKVAVPGSVLVVDDVATSGSHIEEATGLLRRSASHVAPVVWIGG